MPSSAKALAAPVPVPPSSGVRLRLVRSGPDEAAAFTGGAEAAMATRTASAQVASLSSTSDGSPASATLSPENARPTTLRAVNDTGSHAPQSPPQGPGLQLAAADVDVLVARAQRGDRWAFTELFRRHRTDVSRLVYRMMGPSADLEDIVQEVFLQVHRSIGEFRGQAKFSTWLHRVTVNVVLMARRAARSRPVLTGETPTEYEPDAGLTPDEDAMRRRRIDAFRRLLERLPEKKRTVFELHELCGWSPAEIAEHVKAPVLTVRTRLFYARREIEAMIREEPALAQLADELGDDGDDGKQGHESPAARSEAGTVTGQAGVEEAP